MNTSGESLQICEVSIDRKRLSGRYQPVCTHENKQVFPPGMQPTRRRIFRGNKAVQQGTANTGGEHWITITTKFASLQVQLLGSVPGWPKVLPNEKHVLS